MTTTSSNIDPELLNRCLVVGSVAIAADRLFSGCEQGLPKLLEFDLVQPPAQLTNPPARTRVDFLANEQAWFRSGSNLFHRQAKVKGES